jgi:phospholipid/cholesterol/gamma-HCH transport system permease protein
MYRHQRAGHVLPLTLNQAWITTSVIQKYVIWEKPIALGTAESSEGALGAKTYAATTVNAMKSEAVGNQQVSVAGLRIAITVARGDMSAVFRGRLTAASVAASAGHILDPIVRSKPRELIIDASDMSYCDGAGIGLIAEVRRTAALHGGVVQFRGLSQDLQGLMMMSSLQDPRAPQLHAPDAPGLVTQVGIAMVHVLADLRAMTAFLGELVAAILWAIAHPRRMPWRDLWMIAEKVGVNAVPILSLLGVLMGIILAFQSAVPMERYGARDAVPAVVSVAVLRELGPLITAVLLAGRSGSAFAAEIGTMKITEELSALQSMGIHPVRFLAVPRVVASMFVTPLLCVVCNAMGIIGGYLVMSGFGYTALRYANATRSATNLSDVMGGIAKTVVFALLVSGVGCLRGMRTASGPGAVGDSTTRAVVAGIVLVIIADGIFGFVFYYLKI